ncbi:MAG: transposase [Candidatus Undinarchaeales archaeon]|jgi:putative transposase|nr:transposase [Candidatus Undinarchaeales archaeon]
MRRTNTFALSPSLEQDERLHELADGCARLWNEISYRRRQSIFNADKVNWNTKDLYDRYKCIIGSATAQQIERKNSEAWRSFFALLELKKKGKLPPRIQRVSPPGYWKHRSTGKRKQLILIRCDCYTIEGSILKLPKKLEVNWRGKPKWNDRTRQGLLTLLYDSIRRKWYARQIVEVDPPHQPLSNKRAFVDLGVLELLDVVIEGDRRSIAYSGRPALSDWWYLSRRIDRLKSIAKRTNGRKTTKQIRSLFRKRKLRFRQYVNTIVRKAIERLWREGVSEIVVGDLTGIRDNATFGKKSDSMIHNFWSHRFLLERLQCVAQEYGIKVTMIDERGTSSVCPWCGDTSVTKRGRLLKCRSCGIEAHRDTVGAINIGVVFGGRVNGVLAHPLEVTA